MHSSHKPPLAPSRRRNALLAISALSAGLLAFSGAAMAADAPFPNKPIRFIVPYTAGGTTDLVARTVGAHMEKTLGQPVLIDNRGGAGTSMHLAGVVFGQISKTEWVHVPYKGSAPMLNDLLGGQIGVAFDNLPASLPHIKAGKLHALAVASAQRSPALPDVPTLAEAGLPGYAIEPWFGVYAPAGLPAPILQRLQSALQAAVNDPGVKQKLLDAGFTPRSSSAAELEALTRSEYERLGKVAQAAHMTLD